jgi:uncharacterized protein YjbI with pentapeptide repeats
MPVPQELGDLPYAQYLEPYDGELTPEGDYTELHFADAEFEDFDAGNSRMVESACTGVTFTNGAFRRARFKDVWFSRARWVGTSLAETDWLDVTVLNSFLAGVEAYGAKLRRVTFQECKINTLNLRGATIQDVVFDRCEVAEVDLGAATLTNVTFPGSTIRQLRVAEATLTKVDFRGAAELDIAGGCESLRGAVITSTQLLALAPALAQTLGIVVNDR